jgi:hypothetical protein
MVSLPVEAPVFTLNLLTIALFNTLYYSLPRKLRQRVHYADFLLPARCSAALEPAIRFEGLLPIPVCDPPGLAEPAIDELLKWSVQASALIFRAEDTGADPFAGFDLIFG